jgi:anti-sigma regulatory factor (Ser/Thr protein kinase)
VIFACHTLCEVREVFAPGHHAARTAAIQINSALTQGRSLRLAAESTARGKRTNEGNPNPGVVTAMSRFEANRLELRSDLAELKRLTGWIKACARQELSADTLFAIQLCLEEAVANIIMYSVGAKDDCLEITIEWARNGGMLVARIEDTGREFDPTQVPSPLLVSSLEEAKVGGLGIHLIRSFASGMHYERCDGRNRLTLRFVERQARSQQPR